MNAPHHKEIPTEGLTSLAARFRTRYAAPAEYVASSLLALLVAYYYYYNYLWVIRGAPTFLLGFSIAWAATAGLSSALDRFVRSVVCGAIAGIYLWFTFDVIIVGGIGLLVAGLSSVPSNVRQMPLAWNGVYRIARSLWAVVVIVLCGCSGTLIAWVAPTFVRSLSSRTSGESLGPMEMCFMTAYLVAGLLVFRVISRPLFGAERPAPPVGDLPNKVG